MRKLYFVAILSLMFTSSAFAVSGSANISSEIYSFETDSLKHYQVYQSLQSRLTLYQQNKKQITFSTYGRWRTDLENKFDLDPQLFIYDFQVSFNEFVKSSKLSFGRQYVYSNVGSALIDGISIKSTLIPNSEISINAGSEVNRLDPEKIQNLSDNFIAGLRYNYRFDKNSTIGLNWFLRNKDNQVTTNRVGLDLNKRLKSISMYSRVTYNLSLYSFNEVLMRGSYQLKEWYVSLEGRYREPLVNSNSLFAIIDSKKYKRGRVDIQYKLNSKTRLISQVRYTLFDDDNSVAGSFGVRIADLSFFYNYQRGRGSENNGLSGTASHKINNETSMYASVNLSRYKIQDDYDELSDAYSTAIGVVRTFSHNWQVRGEWQYLRNAVESSSSRIYAKLSKQLSFK